MTNDSKLIYILSIKGHLFLEKKAYVDPDKAGLAAGIAAVEGYKVSIKEIPICDWQDK